MSFLRHAEAHEQLMDLTLEPQLLRRLAAAVSEGGQKAKDDPLIAHIVSCATCRGVLASWERTHATVRQALDGPPGSAVVPLESLAGDAPILAPAELRSAVLDLVSASPQVTDPEPSPDRLADGSEAYLRRSQPRSMARRFLPLVAVVGIVALAGGLAINQSTRLEDARRETAALEEVAAVVDRVLRDPGHRVVELRAADGVAAGSISWSSRDLVVLTGALQPPPAGMIYACWIERDGARSPVGQMWFAGDTAFWTGSLDEWATTSFGSGTFGVSLEPIVGQRGHPAVLVGDLGT